MMRRKFSLANIPLLNIGPSRLDNKQLRDQLISPIGSRPPTPKSVRPPLPFDVDAELRAACTYIVTHPKPSHELWTPDAPKPALDYAAVKYDTGTSAAPAAKPSTRSRSAAPRYEIAAEAANYSYKPNVATEDLFRQDGLERRASNAHAVSRVDQLMAPEPIRIVTINPPSQSQPPTHSEQRQLAPVARSENLDKNRASTRSDSVGTTGSTPHTDTTEYPWSASTPLTSAAITPARGSKRASSQNVGTVAESNGAPKVQPVNGDWMRTELEKHKKAIEDRERERERDSENSVRPADATSPALHHTPSLTSRIPPRKPVPSRPESRQAQNALQEDAGRGRPERTNRDYPPVSYRGRSESSRPIAQRSNSDRDEGSRGRGTMRSSSRLGRAASRAASRAGSITNDIITHYFKPGTTPATQDARSPVDPTPAPRSSSRVRNVSRHIKDYIRPSRPETAMDSRKPSMDTNRGHARTGSSGSLHSSASASKATNADASSRWRNWHSSKKTCSQATTPDMSRPGSSGSAMKARNAPSETRKSPPKTTKPPIDLNRELPPLPGLDQWKAEGDEPEPELELTQPAPATSKANPSYSAFRRALSRRHKLDFKGSSQTEHNFAARIGSPTPPLSQKQSVDMQRFEPIHATPSPPVSISPDLRSPEYGLQQLSQSGSQDPMSNNEQRVGLRLRSTSNQGVRPQLVNITPKSVYSANFSTSAAAPATGKRRVDMRNDYASPTTSTKPPYIRSRTNSDKLSSVRNDSVGDHELGDPRYNDMLAVPQDQLSDRPGSRRKWWQSKEKQQHANWMDQVMKSGARNGVLISGEEAADSPVVRF